MQVLLVASLLLLQAGVLPAKDRIKEKSFAPSNVKPMGYHKNYHRHEKHDYFCYVKENEVFYFGGACIYCKEGWDKKTCWVCGVLHHEKKVEKLFHYDYSIKYIWNYGQ
jgi:hypothetical protein